jgi:hypothetical protein
MQFEERSEIRSSRRRRGKPDSPRCFNLDLHIGIIPDIQRDLELQGVSLFRWSASAHNHLVEGRRPVSDPVRHVNAWTYHDLSQQRIDKFQQRYRRFLETFQGFVVTYPPTFAQLFSNLDRPVLVVVAQRYEEPYTSNRLMWARFDEFIRTSVERGSLTVCANNRADADYLEYCAGLKVPVVPSLCDKNGARWVGGTERNVVFGRSGLDIERVEAHTKRRYVSVKSSGTPYQWLDVLKCREAFVLPSNVSLMTLFELATAGVPVAVPSAQWMRSLIDNRFSVLGELTFTQILGHDTSEFASGDPRNWKSESYLDWWLGRADFYDSCLMPNVRIVDSFEELSAGATAAERAGAGYLQVIEERNSLIHQNRAAFMRTFVEKVSL